MMTFFTCRCGTQTFCRILMCDNRTRLHIFNMILLFFRKFLKMMNSTKISHSIPPPSLSLWRSKWYSIIYLQTYHHVAGEEWLSDFKQTPAGYAEKNTTNKGWKKFEVARLTRLTRLCIWYIYLTHHRAKESLDECFNQSELIINFQVVKKTTIWLSGVSSTLMAAANVWQMRSTRSI